MLEEDIFPFLMLNNSIIKSALHGREQTSTASPVFGDSNSQKKWVMFGIA
jgi:hypothetical protein